MKRLFILFLILFSLPAHAEVKPGAPVNNLTTLIGVAVPGLNVASPGIPCPATTGIDPECQYYANKNLLTWRVAISWETIQPTLGGALNTTYLGYLQNIIRQAGLLNAKVIIDVHNYGTYNGVSIDAAGGPTYAQYANLWSLIATAVHGQAGLGGYELMNEPQNMPSSSVVPIMYQAAITAVRAVDTTTPFYLDGDAYASAYGWLGNCANCGGAPIGGWAPGGNTDLLTITDPSNLITFVAHSYGDSNGEGVFPPIGCANGIPTNDCEPGASACTSSQTSYECAQTMMDQLPTPAETLDTTILVRRFTPFVNWCTAHNVSCAVTESGVPYDDPNWLTALTSVISTLFLPNNVLFTYWAAGPDGQCLASSQPTIQTNCGYTLGVYPANINTAPIDTLQMAVLDKFDNSYPPSAYQLYGPQRGTSGDASSVFTVVYNANITKAFTVVPNDNGAGGTFSPTSISCSTGYNCFGTFTYTAPGVSVYQIGTTNTGGLADPPAVGYATVSDIFSTNGLTSSQVQNIFSMCKLYAPYIGNVVTLRRPSDNAVRSFGFTSTSLGSCVNSAQVLAWNGTGETDALAGTNIVVQYSQLFSSDGGVTYVSSGTPLVKVLTPPTVGQYNVSNNGHYTFNVGDVGNTVRINYLFPTYVLNWYDQGPNVHNAGPPISDGTAISPPTIADQPQFQTNCQNGLPCIYWNNNRMEENSIFANSTGQTILSVINPTISTGNSVFNVGWGFTGDDTMGTFDNDIFNNTTMPNNLTVDTGQSYMKEYELAGSWQAIGGTYNVSTGGPVENGGALLGNMPSGGHNWNTVYRSYSTQGFSVFGPNNYSGYESELIVLAAGLTNTQLESFQSAQISRFGLTSFPAYTFVAPTLNQSTTAQNAAPWYGVSGGSAGIGFPQPPNAEYGYWSSRGANIYRFVVQWEAVQPNLCTGNTTLNPSILALMDAAVALNTAAGVDTMFDLHNYGGYNYSYNSPCASPPDNGHINNPTTQSYFVNYWTQIAAHYASNPKVIFDLMNEPVDVTDAQAIAADQAVVTALRSGGYPNWAFVEFSTGNSACSSVSTAGGPAFLGFTDSLSKSVLDCHQYLTTCGYDGCAPIADQGQGLAAVQSATTYVQSNNIKLFWGEAGIAAYTPSMYAETKSALDYVESHLNTGSGGWMGFVAWGAGTWSETYPFKQDPLSYPTPYVDRPTVRLLNTYFTSGTWPATQTFTNCYGGGQSCMIQFP